MLSFRVGAVCSSRRVALIRASRRALSDKKVYNAEEEAMKRMEENMGKLSGIEAVNALPARVHMANLITATGLFGFVGFVFWYSMSTVGQVTSEDDALTIFEQEASAGRAAKAKQAAQDRTVEELAGLDIGMSEKDIESQGITLAVAAPDDIATREEDLNKSVLKPGEAPKRSLVNRIVFFWR
ncbi:hypothetical protein MHU86_15183 [Fragilaria crotonensis]|nr:hypothetical protein MHU86_15183 [Fragilaria crotonensis]